MEQPNQFRSSFNGFNRQDVVRYMEFMNNRHASQVAQLTNELEYLRGKQDTLDAGRVAQLEKELSAARAENAALKERVAQLEQQTGHPGAAPTGPELEAYRRAERVERTARERARQLSRQAAQVLDQTGSQVEDAAGQIAQLSARLREQLEQLQDAMDAGRRTVREAVGAVQALDEGQDAQA